MHLVHKSLIKEALPATLPPNLVPPSKRKALPGGMLPGAVPVLPGFGGPGSGRNTPTGRSDSPSIRVMKDGLLA